MTDTVRHDRVITLVQLARNSKALECTYKVVDVCVSDPGIHR
jgi:hypothetical protein